MLLSAVLATTATVSAMDCATPAALDALRGVRPATHSSMLIRPASLTPPVGPPPPDRTHYGSPLEDHYDTEHFSINWWDASVSPEDVSAAAEALEMGWQAFIEAQGWPAPASSESWYLWVMLDPSLGSTTGYTTEYSSDDYPDGYPIIYINPHTREAYGEDFYAALAAHEFMHAIQFGMRDYGDAGGDLENWYWEASATHASELADPTVDGHQYTSEWYAMRPEVRYDSYESSHQYGMFVFNAWLEDALGAHTMRATWEASVGRAGQPWPTILEAATATPPEVLWAGFTHAYGNQTLPESHQYAQAAVQGPLSDTAAGTLPELGTHYWTIDEDTDVGVVSGDVILGGAAAAMAPVPMAAGAVLSVTAVADSTDYVLQLAAPGELVDPPIDDSGHPADSGETDATEFSSSRSSDGDKGGCATAPAAGGLLFAMLAVFRNRQTLSP